ncbi:hypothetical protein IMSAGC019_02090 [Lachnospiraceae bacterium]|nr:hypothetical protein IMSAGC019_02090 [Lachnospiraceae bacterium]
MGRMILCMGKYAQNPYYLENACTNIYCVEELCYLFASNPFIINKDIMDKKLAIWLDQECGLGDLGHQLLGLFNRGSQAGTFVGMILDYVNYCTPKEKKRIEEVLQGSAGLSEYEKKKKQADFLLKNRRYRMALGEYDGLRRSLPEQEAGLKPAIYHNMGVAYGGIFEFELAAKYFKRAYELSGSQESGIQYLTAQRLHLRESAYISFMAEHGEYLELSLEVEKRLKAAKGEFEAGQENRMLTALKIYKDEGNVASYYEDIDKIIYTKKEEYRMLVGTDPGSGGAGKF